MDKPLISVIIPVYNVEAYLRECVESVVAQTYENLEIILVDDGATDGSGSLCDELAATDGRISVIHKRNGGLSDARNAGLRKSTSGLISFIDSDDFVSPIFIEALYAAMAGMGTKIAAVSGGHNFHDGDEVVLEQSLSAVAPAPGSSPLRSRSYQRLMLYQAVATGAQWRLYTREVLGRDPFPVGLYYEDLASTYKFVRSAGDVALIDCRDLYAYRQRPTSIIRQSYSPIKGKSALKVAKQIYADITAWYPELQKAVSSRCFSVCRMVFAQMPPKSEATPEVEADRKALWEVIKRYRKTVLTDPDARKRERLAAGIACLGQAPFRTFCSLARKMGLMQ